ncbi:hypothetical protein N7E02_03160 (plasmid) [Aliirhizobium terrae]|nr:hypothetical protein [Rhizobium sp. CC-CFT758]WJH37805.1 hypothetical protein N7E02_03160 [Rhizobium sp. CC-CFT758]
MTQSPTTALLNIDAQPDDVLLRLPELGSLMMIGKGRGPPTSGSARLPK